VTGVTSPQRQQGWNDCRLVIKPKDYVRNDFPVLNRIVSRSVSEKPARSFLADALGYDAAHDDGIGK
jgi:hypothetical protein